ncbi:MAG: molybdopterin-binding protein [Oscillospiraceae bacterium]|jgi:Molybdopterin biosynthesis enzyme|nr:molybdopterin-binding protein [Oscillospiraceae bacterium]MBQ6159723.1 molybdopterin-binding protein [Oscillospiraceae bacterium]
MKLIKTEEAVGHVLCHDLTQIIPGQFKGARFRKGHVVTEADLPVLLSMGKEKLYVWELEPGMLHENDAAARLVRLCKGPGMAESEVREGKIELKAEFDGLFRVDTARLGAVNAIDELMIATRRGNTAVRAGDKLCGTRVIPLVIREEKLRAAEAAAGDRPLLELLPWKLRSAAVVTTGGEVAKGLVQDAFTPVLAEKLKAYGIEIIYHSLPGDEPAAVRAAIEAARAVRPDLILCTGGMSVDPDDNTPGAIKATGPRIVSYGAPVLPGAMLLLAYYEDGTPILGLPGCVMYAKATVFDRILPRVAAGVELSKADLVALGEGGLCLGCETCHYPICPFGG